MRCTEGGQAGWDGRVMIKADREAKQQAASRDAGKDSSKKPAKKQGSLSAFFKKG